MEKGLKVKWSLTAEQSLKSIFDFYAEKSESAAFKIINEIIELTESISFYHQYQKDEIAEDYRRMIVRHYKIIYRVEKQSVYVLEVFDTRQDPGKLLYLAEPIACA